MRVRINGVGVVGGFGCDTRSLEEAVIRQKSLVTAPWRDEESETGKSTLVNLRRATDTSLLSGFFPAAAVRRVDHYSRMAILAASLALQEARQDAALAGGLPEPIGLIVATGMGPTAGTLDSQAPDAEATELRLSPIQFSNSVHNMAAAYISMLMKIRGPNVSINQYDLSVPLAFQTAMDWLEEGRAASLLVGGVDCFSQGLTEVCRQTENHNDQENTRSIPVGEGSAFFVLTRDETESRYPSIRGVQIGGCLSDMALPADALFLHNGSGEEARLLGPKARQAIFSHVYGTFPSSMVLDLAMAALLLRKDSGAGDLLRHFDFAPDFLKNPRICCMKKGVAGDLALIDVE